MPAPARPFADTVEAHLNDFARPTAGLYVSILVILSAVVASLPLIRVDVTLKARGVIRPTIDKHQVVMASGGFVDLVWMTDQQRVQAGEPLLRLRSEQEQERRRLVQAQFEESQLRIADLQMLVRWLDDPRAAPVLRTAVQQAEYQSFVAAAAESNLRVQRAEAEVIRSGQLAAAGITTSVEYEDRSLERDRLLLEHDALRERYRTTWRRQAISERAERDRAQELLGQIDSELARHVVRAPVSGTLEQLLDLSPGSFIPAGDQVATVSPDAPLVAEVYVSTSEFGLLELGGPARVLVDALNYQDWGFLTGRVATLPEDYTVVGDLPVFRTLVSLDETRLRLPNGATREIAKGMAVQARFPIAERSLWQLLRDDLNDWLNPLQFTPTAE